MKNKRKLKCMFISMPIVDLTDVDAQKYLFDTRSIVNIPYGLLSICAYVQKYAENKAEFKIIDINDKLVTEYRNNNIINNAEQYFEKFIEEEVMRYNPDIVGISVMFNINYKFLELIAAKIKKIMPDTIVIVGGNLATVIYDEIASKENIDAVVYGEGEMPWLQLIESDDVYSHINENKSFVSKESLRVGVKPINAKISDLDSIPPIDFSYVSFSNFNLPKIRGAVYKKKFTKKMVSRIIYTSRGCPYGCNFCAGFNVHGKRVRTVSIGRIVGDVKQMIENDGLTELFVCDDAFLNDKVRAKAILKEFVEMKIHVNFPSILMRNIDDEIAELLVLLGNTFQYTSMESGSDYVLRRIIEKPISKSEAKAAVNSLRKFDINVLTNIVIGSPGETDDHRKETLATLYDIGFSWVFFMIALPVPGSRLYKQCEENGYIVSKFFYSRYFSDCNIKTPDYSPDHIEWQAYMMNLSTNFINNYNMRIGNYDECIVSFTNVVKSFPGHAFAYYGLMKAYEGKSEKLLAGRNKNKFYKMINKNIFWKNWAMYFELI